MRASSERFRLPAGPCSALAVVILIHAGCRSSLAEREAPLAPREGAIEAPAPAPAARKASPAPPWSPEEGRGVLSNAGSYWVSTLGPAEWPQNEEFDLIVRVLDGPTRTRVVRDAEIRLDARMPAHGHGMTRDVKLEPQPDGSWLARGLLFHMVGHWELYVDLRRGPITERAQFDIDLE